MPKIYVREIRNAVAELCIEANINLRRDVYQAIGLCLAREKSPRARRMLKAILDNADCARKLKLAICQDTGLTHVFVELGQKVIISGGEFLQAINQGIEQGYKSGNLRNSVVTHPLRRKGAHKFSPGVVQIDIVKGNHIKLTVLPKGFGSENKAAVKMFNPSADIKLIKDFVLQQVKDAGPDSCPPFIVGLGIGGGTDKAASLAKAALLRPINKKNPDRFLGKLEKELLREINRLGIGPMGLGGRTTCLGVSILTHPTHIAGLPVAVNICCYLLRWGEKVL